MRRILMTFAFVLLGFVAQVTLLSARTFAINCTNGSTASSDGASCVCPDGNAPQTDGTCSTNPFSQACINAPATATACATDPTKNPVSGKDGIIFKVINIFSYVIGVASVIMILIGGLRYVIANGDSNSIGTAKNTILYAIIGVVVFLLSRGIIVFVVNKV